MRKKSSRLKALVCGLNRGFTLIEFMVAASIMGLIGLAILTTFGSGFSVYERVQAYGGAQVDTLFALEGIEKDLKNTFPLSTVPFEGESQRIAFSSIIETLEEGEEGEILKSSIGRITYFIGNSSFGAKVLMRSQLNYSQAVSQDEADVTEGEVLVPIQDISFRYFFYDVRLEEYGWNDSWSVEDQSKLEGVEIVLTYQNVNMDVKLVRTVFIPATGDAATDEEGGEGESGE